MLQDALKICTLAEATHAARGVAPRYPPRINRTEVGKTAGEQMPSLHTQRNTYQPQVAGMLTRVHNCRPQGAELFR